MNHENSGEAGYQVSQQGHLLQNVVILSMMIQHDSVTIKQDSGSKLRTAFEGLLCNIGCCSFSVISGYIDTIRQKSKKVVPPPISLGIWRFSRVVGISQKTVLSLRMLAVPLIAPTCYLVL